MHYFPFTFVPVLVTIAILNLVAGSTDASYVNSSSNNTTTRVSTDYSNLNSSSADDVATRFSTDDSYVNISAGFSTDDSYVNTSREDVTRISNDDSYVNTSRDDLTTRFPADDPYINTSRDDVTRLHQKAGTCDKLRQCQNGGMCIPRHGQYYCQCLRGTSGDLCEIVDMCYVDKCKNGSKCVYGREQLTAICVCPDPDLKYDSVAGKCKKTCKEDYMCKNGGLCIYRREHLFCECKLGTRGTFCEIAHETCDVDFQCYNDGTCEKTELGSYCKCRKGTEGDFCEEVPACKNLDCGKDAECKFNSSSVTVRCECTDYKLTFDEKDKTCKDLCANFCENGGKCDLYNGVPRCDCRIPFYGDHCELGWEDPCLYYTCENNGMCVAANGSQVPVCVCPSPFYGDRCELGGNDKNYRSLYSVIWVLCSFIILLILVSCCLLITICRKKGGK